jgi:hypothetical protein
MSHDIQAAWAAAEIATCFKETPENFFVSAPSTTDCSIYAARAGREGWPVADGVVVWESPSKRTGFALEYKRPQEGLHGILTALGQAQAYIHKGYAGSMVVIPAAYESHPSPAKYLKEVIDTSSPSLPIGVFHYTEPDSSAVSPFKNKISCIRPIDFSFLGIGKSAKTSEITERSETQWAHLREGSSDPDAFFKYLSTAKIVSASPGKEPSVRLLPSMDKALSALGFKSKIDKLKYLSNSKGDSFHDRVWRHFWFRYIIISDTMPIYSHKANGKFVVNTTTSGILLPDGKGYKQFFCGRKDSIKEKLVEAFNSGSISEDQMWISYLENLHDRAHSYREDIDSGLNHLGFIEEEGRVTDLGYRYLDACERNRDPNTGLPNRILALAILREGKLGAFLHYIYHLSQDKFSKEPKAFSSMPRSLSFDKRAYLLWLEDELANNLRVMRKVSKRGGSPREPFQAELAILRRLGCVSGFRPCVGLEINWPYVQEVLSFDPFQRSGLV